MIVCRIQQAAIAAVALQILWAKLWAYSVAAI